LSRGRACAIVVGRGPADQVMQACPVVRR